MLRADKEDRLNRVIALKTRQKDFLIACILGLIDSLERYPSCKSTTQEILNLVDLVLDKEEMRL